MVITEPIRDKRYVLKLSIRLFGCHSWKRGVFPVVIEFRIFCEICRTYDIRLYKLYYTLIKVHCK
jgi:hypothetical protein